MNMRRCGSMTSIHALFAVALCSTVQLPRAYAADAPRKMGGEIAYKDRFEIQDLFMRYSYYLDERQGEAFASLFVNDGEIVGGPLVVKGHDQLVAFASRPRTVGFSMHFVGNNLLVQTSPSHVRARSMLILGTKNQAPEGSASFNSFSIYEDDIVKTPSGWRFARRTAGRDLPISPEFVW
jgi:hypothetical protein